MFISWARFKNHWMTKNSQLWISLQHHDIRYFRCQDPYAFCVGEELCLANMDRHAACEAKKISHVGKRQSQQTLPFCLSPFTSSSYMMQESLPLAGGPSASTTGEQEKVQPRSRFTCLTWCTSKVQFPQDIFLAAEPLLLGQSIQDKTVHYPDLKATTKRRINNSTTFGSFCN